MGAVGQLLESNKADGPFVLGARPSGTDFFIVGILQCARTVDERVFQRTIEFPGPEGVYSACFAIPREEGLTNHGIPPKALHEHYWSDQTSNYTAFFTTRQSSDWSKRS